MFVYYKEERMLLREDDGKEYFISLCYQILPTAAVRLLNYVY